MRIRARSYATMRMLTAHLGNGGELEIPAGSTPDFVLTHLNAPRDTPKIVLVNGRHAALSQVLQDGDLLVFYPLLEGG